MRYRNHESCAASVAEDAGQFHPRRLRFVHLIYTSLFFTPLTHWHYTPSSLNQYRIIISAKEYKLHTRPYPDIVFWGIHFHLVAFFNPRQHA